MGIGIYDLNECSNLNYKERLDLYKEVGFTSVGLYLDNKYMKDNESYIDIIEYAFSIGLEVNQVHLDYKISNSICEDDTLYFDYVSRKLEEASKFNIKYLVVHASKGDEPPLLNEKGVNKLKELMKKYQNKDIYLCFENVRSNNNLDIIINENINNIGVCFDIGHAHCYDDEYRLLDKYKEKILCSHLHNNYGEDSHNSLEEGEIDVSKVISMLITNNMIDNCLEVFPKRGVNFNKEEFKDFMMNNYSYYCKCIKL